MTDDLDKYLDAITPDLVNDGTTGGNDKPKTPTLKTPTLKAPKLSAPKTEPDYDVTPILERMRGSVREQESGGNPNAVNGRTKATGLFQVIPANIPNWTRTYLNREMSVDEFKRDPQAQEKVFSGEMGKYLKKAMRLAGGDEDKAIRMAAAAWYGGEGAMHRFDDGKRFRANEPSFKEYTESVLNRTRKKTDDPLDTYLSQFAPDAGNGSTAPPPAASYGEIGDAATQIATPETLKALGIDVSGMAEAGNPVAEEFKGIRPPAPTAPKRKLEIADGEDNIYTETDTQLDVDASKGEVHVADKAGKMFVARKTDKGYQLAPSEEHKAKQYSPDEVESGYREYLNYLKVPDTPETKEKYLAALKGQDKAGATIQSIEGVSVEDSVREGFMTRQREQSGAQWAEGYRMASERPEYFVTQPDVPQVFKEMKTDEDFLKTAAGTVHVDVTRKPSGMNLGEFLLRQSLKAVQPEYGYSEADIERVVRDRKDRFGKWTGLQTYPDFTDDEFKQAVASLKEQNKGEPFVKMTLSRSVIQDAMGERKKEWNDRLLFDRSQVIKEVQTPGNFLRARKTMLERDAEAMTREQLKNPSWWDSAERNATEILTRAFRLVPIAGLYRDISEFRSQIENPPSPDEKITEQVEALRRQHGTLRDYQFNRDKAQKMDWFGEYGIRFLADIARGAVRTSVADTFKGVEFWGEVAEKTTPLQKILPDRLRPNVRNLGNLIGYTVAYAQHGKEAEKYLQDAGSDIDKRLFYNIGKSVDEALGDDPYLRGKFAGSVAQGLGSGIGFMAMGMVAPQASILNRFAVSSAALGVMTMGGAGYSEAKEQGLSEDQSQFYAAISGLLGATEGFGVGAAAIRGIRDAGLKRLFISNFLDFAKRGGKTVINEAGEEILQEFVQSASGKAALEAIKDKEPSAVKRILNIANRLPGQLADTAIKEVPVAAISGGVLGGGMHIATGALSSGNQDGGTRVDLKNNLIEIEGELFSFSEKSKDIVGSWIRQQSGLETIKTELESLKKKLSKAKTPEEKFAVYTRASELQKEAESLSVRESALMQAISNDLQPVVKDKKLSKEEIAANTQGGITSLNLDLDNVQGSRSDIEQEIAEAAKQDTSVAQPSSLAPGEQVFAKNLGVVEISKDQTKAGIGKVRVTVVEGKRAGDTLEIPKRDLAQTPAQGGKGIDFGSSATNQPVDAKNQPKAETKLPKDEIKKNRDGAKARLAAFNLAEGENASYTVDYETGAYQRGEIKVSDKGEILFNNKVLSDDDLKHLKSAGSQKKPSATNIVGDTAGDTASQAVQPKKPTGTIANSTVVDYTPEDKSKNQIVVTERNTEVEITPQVIDDADILTSFDEGFPAELQPRDRSRIASELQIEDIANNLNPRRLDDTFDAGQGRPILVPVEVDGKTKYAALTANGRITSIRRNYDRNHPKAEEYRNFAITKDGNAKNLSRPIYAGILNNASKVNLADFAEEANEGTSQLSAVEQAVQDAKKLDDALLNNFEADPDGNLNTEKNQKFNQRFFELVVNQNQRGRFVSSGGELSQEGVMRIRNAIFAKAFGDSQAGMNALAKIAEDTDVNVRNIANAFLKVSGIIAKYKDAADADTRFKELDIAQELASALEKYSFLRDKKIDVETYVNQRTLPGQQESSPFEKTLLLTFESFKRSSRALAQVIENYYAGADAAGDPAQGSMFGPVEAPDKMNLLQAAVETQEAGIYAKIKQSASLFAGDVQEKQSDQSETVQESDPESGGEIRPAEATVAETAETAEVADQPTDEDLDNFFDDLVPPAQAQTEETPAETPGKVDNLSTPTETEEKEEKEDETYKFSSTQVNLPDDLASEVRRYARELISESDLTEDGFEDKPHITIKYGIHAQTPRNIKDVLESAEPFSVTLGKLGVFKGENQDVVYIKVKSSDLRELNEEISEATKVTDTHPRYVPHITLAYVQKGKGETYKGNDFFDGKEVQFNAVEFSSKSGEKTEISLNEKPETETPQLSDLKVGTQIKLTADFDYLKKDEIYNIEQVTANQMYFRGGLRGGGTFLRNRQIQDALKQGIFQIQSSEKTKENSGEKIEVISSTENSGDSQKSSDENLRNSLNNFPTDLFGNPIMPTHQDALFGKSEIAEMQNSAETEENQRVKNTFGESFGARLNEFKNKQIAPVAQKTSEAIIRLGKTIEEKGQPAQDFLADVQAAIEAVHDAEVTNVPFEQYLTQGSFFDSVELTPAQTEIYDRIVKNTFADWFTGIIKQLDSSDQYIPNEVKTDESTNAASLEPDSRNSTANEQIRENLLSPAGAETDGSSVGSPANSGAEGITAGSSESLFGDSSLTERESSDPELRQEESALSGESSVRGNGRGSDEIAGIGSAGNNQSSIQSGSQNVSDSEISDDDLDSYFDTLVPAEKPKTEKTPSSTPRPPSFTTKANNSTTKPKNPTASDKLKSAGSNTKQGIDDVMKGLNELFNPNKFKSSSFPAFDEKTYEAAKPMFLSAYSHFKDAAKDVFDAMRLLVDEMRAKGYTDETLRNMKPYIVQFAKDLRDGKISTEEEISDEIFDDVTDEVSGEEDSGELQNPSFEEKLRAQQEAEKISVSLRDADNIRATLPVLLSEQQDDVLFAENAYFNDEKPHLGVMLTNGTGTGKTFSGLGIVKRFAKQGKDNILIVAPSQEILNAWMGAARHLNLNPRQLVDTADNGQKGIVLTTYANMQQNPALIKRKWDLIVTDEAHKVSSNATGTLTGAAQALRAITLHKRGEYDYRRQAAIKEIYLKDDLERQIEESKRNERTARTSELAAYHLRETERLERAFADLEQQIRRIQEIAGEEFQRRIKSEEKGKVLFLSATPFAYQKSIEYAEGYLFDFDEGLSDDNRSRAYNEPNNRQQFFITHFGYRMRYNKLTEPDADVNTGLMERQFNSWLKTRGVLSGRMLTIEQDYSRNFVLAEDAIGSKIDEGLNFLETAGNGKYKPLYDVISRQFKYHDRMFLLESIKARASIDIIKKHIALGRKVVVFHDFNKGGGFHPFRHNFANMFVTVTIGGTVADVNLGDLYAEFAAERADLIELDFSDLRSPINTFKEAFEGTDIQPLFVNGLEPKRASQQAINLFNQDRSGADLIIVQSDKGQAGISLHDTTGTHQRVLINLGLPVKPVAAIQTEGRIYRVGNQSDAIQIYLNTGTNWERFAFASKIADRASTAENLALGEEARMLKESIIDSFVNPIEEYKPSAEEGKGGKEKDRREQNLISEFDRAKTFYFAQGKKTSRNKAREGVDYFPTPEPIGLKMVEFLDLKDGESALEPSSGHGAIARFFPENTRNTFVEPESELMNRLLMYAQGDKNRFETQKFEDLHASNKFEGIAMNPPYGLGGATSTAHLEKAIGHLRNGGRIVALLPEGPAADKKLNKLLNESATGKDVFMIAEISLPTVTFERAATRVKSKIIVLEKQTGKIDAEKLPPAQKTDLSHIADINELFDALEDHSLPKRLEPTSARTLVYSQLAADAARDNGLNAPSSLQANQGAPANTPIAARGTFEKAEFTHTRDNYTVYVAKLGDRVSSEDFQKYKRAAQAFGGWYNGFGGRGSIKGMAFKQEQAREDFLKAVGHVEDESDDVMMSIFDAPSDKLESFEPMFFLTAVKAIENKISGKSAPVEQVRNILNSPEVKGNEIEFFREFAGIDEWLDSQPNGKVNKQDLIDFLNENNVRLEETVLGDETPDEDAPNVDLEELESRGYEAYWLEDLDGFNLLGGFNKDGKKYPAGALFDGEASKFKELPEEDFNLMVNAVEAEFAFNEGAQSTVKYDQYSLEGGENYQERVFRFVHPNIKPYEDQHWVKPADMWVRSKDFTDADGARVLVIEEIQSGRHQEGRKKGYTSDKLDSKERDAFDAEMTAKYGTEAWWSNANAEERDNWHSMNSVVRKEALKVPDAPFKKNWQELAFKRMLRYAVENGYDKIAWTPGQEQVDRYQLSKAVDTIVYNQIELSDKSAHLVTINLKNKNKHELFVESKTGKVLSVQNKESQDLIGKNFHDVVGKDIAEKILNEKKGVFAGKHLEIGGEGMKAFYDKMLPSFVNKYVKKWNAKVESSDIDIEPPMSEKQKSEMLESLRRIEGFDEDAFRNYKNLVPVHSVRITPEMVAAVMQGQAMFALSEAEENAKRRAFEILQTVPFSELLPLVEISRSNDRVRLNGAGQEVIRRALEQHDLNRGAITADDNARRPSFLGMFAEPKMLNNIIQILREAESAGKKAGVGESSVLGDLANELTEAARIGGRTAVLYVTDDKLPHEIVHQGAYLGAVEKAITRRLDNPEALDNHPAFDKAVDTFFSKFSVYQTDVIMRQMKMSRANAEAYRRAVIREEIAAWIADGSYAKLGLSEDEALDYLLNYMESYARKNWVEGNENALEKFKESSQYVYEAIEKTIQRIGSPGAKAEKSGNSSKTGSNGTNGRSRAGNSQQGNSRGKTESSEEGFELQSDAELRKQVAGDYTGDGKKKIASLPGTERAAGISVDDIEYTVFGDKAAQAEAKKLIEENGIEGTIRLLNELENPDVHHAIASFTIQRLLLDEAERIASTNPKEAENLKNTAKELAARHAIKAVKAGRFIRAASIIQQSVETVIYAAQKVFQDKHGLGMLLPDKIFNRVEALGKEAESAVAESTGLNKQVEKLKSEIRDLKKALAGEEKFRKNSKKDLAKRRKLVTQIKTKHQSDFDAAMARLRNRPMLKIKEKVDAMLSIFESNQPKNSNIELRNQIENLPPVKVSGSMTPDHGKTKDIIKWASENLPKSAVSPAIGEVLIDEQAIKASLGHGYGKSKINSLPALPKIIEQGILVHSETQKEKGKFEGEVFVLASPVKIDNDDYRAFVLVRKDIHTSRLYVHEVIEIEKLPALSKTEANESRIRASGVIRSITERLYGVNNEDDAADTMLSIFTDEEAQELGLDKDLLNDLAIVGAVKLTEGFARPTSYFPSDFDADMLAEFGDSIKNILQPIHAAARKLRNRWLSELSEDKQRAEIIKEFGDSLSDEEIDEILGERRAEWKKRKAIEKLHELRAQKGISRNFTRIEEIIAELGADQSEGVVVGAAMIATEQPTGAQFYDRMKELGYVQPARTDAEARELFRQADKLRRAAEEQYRKERTDLKALINEREKEVGEIEKLRTLAQRRVRQSQDLISEELRRIQRGDAWYYVNRYGWGAVNSFRGLMTSGEFGFMLRQGNWFTWSHPMEQRESLKNMWAGLRAIPFEEAMARLEAHKYFEKAVKAGIDFSALGRFGENSITKGEEEFRHNLFQHIPGLKQTVGQLIEKSETTMQGFLDTQRLLRFASIAEFFESQGMTLETHPRDYKAIANYINAATGRATLGNDQMTSLLMNLPLFAGRYLVSRIKHMGNVTAGWALMPPAARKVVLKDMGRYYGAVGSIMFLAALAGLVSFDWDESDFLKIKLPGGAKFDLTGGLQVPLRYFLQLMTTAARAALGEKYSAGIFRDPVYGENGKVNETKNNLLELDGYNVRFWRSKLAPVPSLAIDYATNEDFLGNEFNWTSALISRSAPLFYKDVYEHVQKDGAAGLLTVAPGFVGFGAQNFAERPEKAETPAEKMASRINGMRFDDRVETPEQRELSDKLADIKARGRKGEKVAVEIKQLFDSGEITKRRAQGLINGLDDTFFESKVKNLPSEYLEQIRKVADDSERGLIQEILDARAKKEAKEAKKKTKPLSLKPKIEMYRKK